MPPVLARNLRPGPTVLTPNPDSHEHIVWGAAGDPDDTQLVSEAHASTALFQRAVARNILVVEGPAPKLPKAVADHLAHQNLMADKARAAAEAKVAETIVRETDKDLVGHGCLGPNTRGNGTCDEMVPMSKEQLAAAPPLCLRHKDLAPLFVPTDVAEGDKVVTRWHKVEMGPREKAPGA